ncbi:hypothetical protein JTB14_011417 [Gonioctena quinquepunctata]|nr:hypothetical protein JTB14_011417 [Gonioctena quinquepunctata]
MAYETISIDKICRTCLSEASNMRSVFSIEESTGENLRLFEMLIACASVQVMSNDGLPSQVCLQCVHYITRAFSFKQLCERSDNTLRELLERPFQQTFLELKPLLASESLVPSSVAEIITGLPHLSPSQTVALEEVVPIQPHSNSIDSLPTEMLKEPQDDLISTEILPRDPQNDLSTKYEHYENDTGFSNDLDSDTGQEEKSDVTVEVKEIKNKSTEDETAQPIYPCEECTCCYTTQADLKAHAKTHQRPTNHTCKVCNQSFASASTLCRHMKVHEGAKRHLCSECGKGFSRSDDLTRHLRTHTGEKPYTSLAAHNKTHSGIKTHVCTVCGKRLCGSGSLAMHMKTHTGLKDHICPFCSKGFTTPSNLIIHKRTHTGERPYVCPTCGKGFPDHSRLTVHSRSHSGEKPYVCITCGRGCVSSSQLKKHMRIHTGERPYKCNLCSRAFPRSEDLNIHVKTHTGDRDFICPFCKKGFYQASTLKVHIRIHTGEKPYTCHICLKSFSQTGPLSTHMKTH